MLTVMLDSKVKVVVPFLVYVPCSPGLAGFLSAEKLKQKQHENTKHLHLSLPCGFSGSGFDTINRAHNRLKVLLRLSEC